MKPNKKFFKWFIKWYKDHLFSTTIMIFLPNELSPEFMERDENTLSIEYFEKTSQSVNMDTLLSDICNKADEYGVKLYIDKVPKKNPTPESIYFKNGFVSYNDTYLVRTPKTI